MTVTTKGFQGTVSDADMATQFHSMPAAVASAADLLVTATAGARSVSIAAGAAWAHFVKYVSDAVQTLPLAAPSSGGKWYAIALNRQWSPTNTCTLEAVDVNVTTDGTVPTTIAAVLTQGGANATLPTWLRANPGTAGSTAAYGSHQVLAFAHVRAADTTVTVFGVRLIDGKAGPAFAENLHALAWHAVTATPARGTKLNVGPHLIGGEQIQSIEAVNNGFGAFIPTGRIFTGATATLLGMGAALKALFIAYSGLARLYGEAYSIGRPGLILNDLSTSFPTDYAWTGGDWEITGGYIEVGNGVGGGLIPNAQRVANFSPGNIDTRASRQGKHVTLNLGLQAAATISPGDKVMDVPAGFRPMRTVPFQAVLFNQGNTAWSGQTGNFTAEPDGRVLYQGMTTQANTAQVANGVGIFGSVTFRAP